MAAALSSKATTGLVSKPTSVARAQRASTVQVQARKTVSGKAKTVSGKASAPTPAGLTPGQECE